MTARVSVTFGEVASSLLRENAKPAGIAPGTLAEAIVVAALRDVGLEAILDGMDPLDLASGHRKLSNGLTHAQAATLYLMAEHSGGDGYCRLSSNAIASLGDLPSPSMKAVIRSLEKRFLITRFGPVRSPFWRVSEIGRSEAERLGATAFRNFVRAA